MSIEAAKVLDLVNAPDFEEVWQDIIEKSKADLMAWLLKEGFSIHGDTKVLRARKLRAVLRQKNPCLDVPWYPMEDNASERYTEKDAQYIRATVEMKKKWMSMIKMYFSSPFSGQRDGTTVSVFQQHLMLFMSMSSIDARTLLEILPCILSNDALTWYLLWYSDKEDQAASRPDEVVFQKSSQLRWVINNNQFQSNCQYHGAPTLQGPTYYGSYPHCPSQFYRL